jgi:hypothetical protein
MSWKLPALPLGLLLVGSLSSAASGADEEPRGCLTIQPNASFDGAGYSHYARVHNDCRSTVRCELWTDVDEAHLPIEVAAGAEAELTFRRGSPASTFRAFARCAFR